MINLLPPRQKQEFVEDERLRLFSILGVLALLFLVALLLILLSVKIYISGKAQSMPIFTPFHIQEQEKIIQETNARLQKLLSFYEKQPRFTKSLETISGTLPKGVYLNYLTITANKVSLRGFSPTRELLVQFNKNLESNQSLEDIDFPPANWLKQQDIEFIVNFDINGY